MPPQSGEGNGGSDDGRHNSDTLPGSTVVPFPGAGHDAASPDLSERGSGADEPSAPHVPRIIKRLTGIDKGKGKSKGTRGPVLPVLNLTAKQEAFVQHVAKGASLTDAYRLAYAPPSASDATISHHASALYAKDEVQARLRQLIQWKQRAEQRVATRSVERWWEKIWAETEAEDATPASRVAALREIGKALGVGGKADEDSMTADQAAKDLEQRIEKAMARAKALK